MEKLGEVRWAVVELLRNVSVASETGFGLISRDLEIFLHTDERFK